MDATDDASCFVLVAHDELLRGARLAQACHGEGLTPVVAFTADDALATLDRLAVAAVVASGRLATAGSGDLVGGVRRRTGAPLVLLCRPGEPPRAAQLHLDVDAPTERVARRVRGLVAVPPAAPRSQAWGALRLESSTRQAWWHRLPLALTAQQFALLGRLVRAQGAVVTTAELAEAVYGQSGWQDTERVRAHVLRIRRRLARVDGRAAATVTTIRGVGFRLRETAGARSEQRQAEALGQLVQGDAPGQGVAGRVERG